MMKSMLRKGFGIMAVCLMLAACNTSEEHPGYIYFPDMTYSQAYETMTPNPNFDDSTTMQAPVPGTIPRGYTPFHYENNLTDYARAGEELTNPIPRSEEVLAEGEHYYTIYCAICHGANGEGDGNIVQREKFPPPPTYYNDYMMNLSDGKMFFSIHYGKNLMGSYASQLTQEERWKVVHYINSLQEEQSGGAPADTSSAATDTTATAMNN